MKKICGCGTEMMPSQDFDIYKCPKCSPSSSNETSRQPQSIAQPPKFCTAYKGCNEKCQACEHFPNNWKPHAPPDLQKEHTAFMSSTARLRQGNVCLASLNS